VSDDFAPQRIRTRRRFVRIVVTNDDGVDAPGIAALSDAAMRFGDVIVIAPADPHSSCGHAFTRSESLVVRGLDRAGRRFAVRGTPVDCVRLAVCGVLGDRPDVVLSGINHGGNVGADVFPSGTVAAAREAAIHGVPAIAISQYVRADAPADWAWAAARAGEVIGEILRGRHDEWVQVRAGLHWNVNLPARKDAGDAPRRVVVAHDAAPLAYRFEEANPDDGGRTFRNAARYQDRAAPDGGDVAALFGGAITLTPLTLSMNAGR
jgi:5'-nucleotidase